MAVAASSTMPPFKNEFSMSYEIFFWREVPGANLAPDRIFRDLEDGLTVPGMVPLPLKSVVATFQQHFPGIRESEGTLEWDSDGGSFEVSFTFLDGQTITLGTIYCGRDLKPLSPTVARL